ncbi:hypothetical protein D3C73_1437770 [compost metagenome]
MLGTVPGKVGRDPEQIPFKGFIRIIAGIQIVLHIRVEPVLELGEIGDELLGNVVRFRNFTVIFAIRPVPRIIGVAKQG